MPKKTQSPKVKNAKTSRAVVPVVKKVPQQKVHPFSKFMGNQGHSGFQNQGNNHETVRQINIRVPRKPAA